ncbi:MAG: energy transducer TonB [Myxococcota bacterium]
MSVSSPKTSRRVRRSTSDYADMQSRNSLRFSWAILGSAWVHLLAGLALLAVPRCEAADPATDPQSVTLLTLAPDPVRDAEENREERSPLDAPTDELTPPDPSIESPAPTPADTLAPGAAPALDPIEAQAIDDPVADKGAAQEIEAEEIDAFDPTDAVADAALPVPAPPKVLNEEPPPAPVVEPDEEREEPDPPEAQKDPRWQTYLRVMEEDASSDENLESTFISSMNARSMDLRQVKVTSDVAGAPTPPVDGLPKTDGKPTIEQLDGTPDGSLGDAPAAGEPVERPAKVVTGGGLQGSESGEGSPESGEGLRGGALARSGRQARSTQSAVAVPASPASQDGAKDARNPDNMMALKRTTWWSPAVVRVVAPAQDGTPAKAPVTAALPTQGTERAPEPKPDENHDRGGTEQETETDEPTPEAQQEETADESGEAEPIEEAEVEEPAMETVADLREAMGWGGIHRQRLRPKRSLPGSASSDTSSQSSQQTVAEDFSIDRLALVDAHSTAKGRYRATVDERIYKNWSAMDLSLHERALGIQGDVTIVLHVRASGKVLDTTLVRSSGHNSLDGMAMDSVPKRLPRFPKDLDIDTIFHRYTFRYRNPMIVGGQP